MSRPPLLFKEGNVKFKVIVNPSTLSYKVLMETKSNLSLLIRIAAAAQLALIFPAALFLTSVLVGLGDPPQYDLALVAHQIVGWYSGRIWTLWLLLIALPFAGLVTGCATLTFGWGTSVELPRAARQSLSMIPAPLATLLVAGTTMISAAILGVVALHMLAN